MIFTAHHRSSPHAARQQRGFALVVVLLLSALLVAMLVALVSMTLAESRVVQASAKARLARAHALKGLQKAVSVLQENVGIDRCTTIPANLHIANPANPWFVAALPRPTTSGKPTEVWLTSGSSVDHDGSKLPEVTGSLELPTPSRTEGRTVWLARHTVNDIDALSVKAVKIPITTKDTPLAKALRREVQVGSYAWWASDESLKAKANLRAQPSNWSGDKGTYEANWQLASAPRSAPWKTADLKALPKDDSRTERVLTLGQLPLLAKTSAALVKGIGNHFHSFTAESLGVLSDARHGGLRRDLSLAFEMNDTAFDEDPIFGITKQGLGGDAGINPRTLNWRTMRNFYCIAKSETFQNGVLEAQASIAFNKSDGLPAERAASANRFIKSQRILLPIEEDLKPGEDDAKISPKKMAFMPQAIRVQHAFSIFTQDAPNPKSGEGPYKLVVALDPVITLWNPYNIKLSTEAMRIDDRLPEVHVVVEIRQPWKKDKQYIPGDEVYDQNKIFKAKLPSRGKQPPGQFGEWEEQQRKWSLGLDLTVREMADLERASFVLAGEVSSTGAASPFVLEPGEIAVFSSSEKSVKIHDEGPLVPTMKRGWNPDGGIGFDRLDVTGAAKSDAKDNLWLRVYDETEMRVTIEPYRRDSQHYKDNDPFEFLKNYKDDPRLHLKEGDPDIKDSDGSESTAYLPFDFAEYLGKFTGGQDLLSSYAWSGTRRGSFINATYDTRAYHGKDEEDELKPLPGMSDQLTVSTHLRPAPATGDAKIEKRYLGLWDWYWKTEADADFPAQSVARFNPRCALIDPSPGLNKKAGYPCTVPHYQVKLERIASDREIVEVDRDFRSFWGPSHTAQGEQHAPLFEIPTAPLISLGQLQHYQTSLSPLDGGYGIGSSWPSPFIDRTATRKPTEPAKEGDPISELVDGSWHVNQQLFDSFFFSSICSYSTSDRIGSRVSAITDKKNPTLLPNARMKLHVPPGMKREEIAKVIDPSASSVSDGPAYDKASAFLMIDGPFNVNSTSVEAWRAVLAGCDNLKVPAYPNGSHGPSDNVLTRLTLTNGQASDHWRGYRSLTDREVESLAEEIVAEVKKRGPFHSLADFVNRKLTTDDTGLCGTLQAAIDRTDINRHVKVQVTEGALQHAAAQHETDEPEWAFPFPAHATGPAMAAVTGCLQQGDILQTLAPILTVRGDTFKIRTYGEVLNPRTGALEARAWCEAIVQRMPEYVEHRVEGSSSSSDKGDPPWPLHDSDGAVKGLTSEVNRDLGRAFRVVRLRWLSPDEI